MPSRPWSLLLPLLLFGCSDIDGTAAGGPCNSRGICVPGLLCEEGICKAEDDLLWERMNRPIQSDLNAVFGTAPDNVFAVGDSGAILRYQGQGLDWVEVKHQLTTSELRTIWGEPGRIWAAGVKAILRWDGASWSNEPVYDLEAKEVTDHYINGLHGAGGQVYAVGSRSSDALLLRYDATGKKWDQVDTVNLSFTPQDIRALPNGELFIVGTSLHVKHFDGTSWQEQNLDAAEQVKLNAIWGTSDGTQLYAVGKPGVLAVYDGKRWSVNSDGRLSFEAHDIAGLSADDLFVVGQSSSYSNPGGIERCAVYCTHNPLPKEAQGKQISGIWVSQDASVAFAVGDDGTILRRQQLR